MEGRLCSGCGSMGSTCTDGTTITAANIRSANLGTCVARNPRHRMHVQAKGTELQKFSPIEHGRLNLKTSIDSKSFYLR